jgi:hypothetical protein
MAVADPNEDIKVNTDKYVGLNFIPGNCNYVGVKKYAEMIGCAAFGERNKFYNAKSWLKWITKIVLEKTSGKNCFFAGGLYKQ